MGQLLRNTCVLNIFLAAFMSMFLTSCAVPLARTGPGALYTSVREPVMATNSDAALSEGRACATNILGLVSVGDASIDAAKKDGDIATVSSVDTVMTSVLLLFVRNCTIVRGKE